MNIPPGYVTREKAVRLTYALKDGLDEILTRYGERMKERIPMMRDARGEAAARVLLRTEIDAAVAEMEALQKALLEQLAATEH